MNIKTVFVILIGGESKRFGIDKGLIKFLGKSFINHQIEILTKISKNIFLSAHDNHQAQNYKNEMSNFDYISTILDNKKILSEQEIRNPLIGIYSSFKYLSNTDFEKAFIISCDLPLIKYEVLKLMLEQSINFDCCIPRWKNGYLEPLFAIYPIKKGYLMAKQNLKLKKYKLRELLNENWKIKYVPVENEIKKYDRNLISFLNINKEEDLTHLKKIIQKNNLTIMNK